MTDYLQKSIYFSLNILQKKKKNHEFLLFL